jgi:hypothetical protein
MNFGYLWPFFSLFILSFIIPRALKYNYFFLSNLFSSIFKLFTWLYIILFNFFQDFFFFFSKTFNFFTKSKIEQKQSNKFSLFIIFNFFFKVLTNLLVVTSYVNLWVFDKHDLMIKTYSHWNYFLPLRWIHRNHRLFFYKRIYYIIFS